MQWLYEHPALLAAAVFLARVLDVSLGTLRTILVFRAYRLLAAVISVEVPEPVRRTVPGSVSPPPPPPS